MKNELEIAYGPLMAGVLTGCAVLYVTHPRHGERRRDHLKTGCKTLGAKYRTSWTSRLVSWLPQAVLPDPDIQAEIRAHASPYLQ